MYINDGQKCSRLVSKFADNTKCAGVADSEDNCQSIKRYIDELQKCIDKFQMEPNPSTCALWEVEYKWKVYG